jgi:uncharacterized protein YdaU (DUF1376 family)
MAREKSPAYQRYPKDYLNDENVVAMTLEEEGAYNRLMDYCWLEGSLPNDMRKLAAMCKNIPAKRMQAIWDAIGGCFTAHPERADRLVHARLERERDKQAEWRLKSSEGGKRSQANRKGGSRVVEQPLQPRPDIAVSSLQSASPVTTSEAKASGVPPEFEPAEKPPSPQGYLMGILRECGYACDRTDGSIVRALLRTTKPETIEEAVRGLAALWKAGELRGVKTPNMRLLYAEGDGVKMHLWARARVAFEQARKQFTPARLEAI